MVLEQLAFKFGPRSEASIAAVAALSDAQLNEIGVRILSAPSLADLGL